MDQPKLPDQNGFLAHQELSTQAHMGSSTESKVIMETTRTTSATMRLEHKSNFPDLPPVTLSQRTQTPTIPLVSEGTMVDSDLKIKQQTESTQTTNEFKTQPPPVTKSVPFPFTTDTVDGQDSITRKSALEFFENNLKNLPALSEEKYTRFEEAVKGSKTYVHKQHEIKESFQSKLNEDLSFFNLQPEPAPEMGFMPKLQTPITEKPEKIIERVKKLEEIHQANEAPLSGTVFPPQNIRKEEKFEKKEFISTKSTSPFPSYKPLTPTPQAPTYTPQINRDQLTADIKVTRSPSPKPSAEGVNMEKLWTTIPKSPEPLTSQIQNQQFTHEHKSSFVAYSSNKQEFTQEPPAIIQYQQPQKENFVPIQPYHVEQQNQEDLPKASIKSTKSFFEQRIKEEEQKTIPTDLKAPGLVKQFAKPMVPLVPVDLEPGSPPEILYAPKPVLERKQSYVEKIEKSLEQNIEKEPERVPRGGIRILPQRQTPQRTMPSPSPVAPSPKTIQPPLQMQPKTEIIKPEPIILSEPYMPPTAPITSIQKGPEPFNSSQFERKENVEFIKKESEKISGYRHVDPPKFLQQQQQKPVETPFIGQPLFSDLFKTKEPEIAKPQVKEIPVQIQKPIYQPPPPQASPKPAFMQPKPSGIVKPPMAKFGEFISESSKQESHSLYKNFVQSEKTMHSSESYFQRIDSPKTTVVQQPPPQQQQPQTKKGEKQQVRRKFFPDVML